MSKKVVESEFEELLPGKLNNSSFAWHVPKRQSKPNELPMWIQTITIILSKEKQKDDGTQL
jgi:hypothetical protein